MLVKSCKPVTSAAQRHCSLRAWPKREKGRETGRWTAGLLPRAAFRKKGLGYFCSQRHFRPISKLRFIPAPSRIASTANPSACIARRECSLRIQLCAWLTSMRIARAAPRHRSHGDRRDVFGRCGSQPLCWASTTHHGPDSEPG